MNINENSAWDSLLSMCITYVKQANMYYGKESNGFKIQDNACKRGLKIDPKQEFTKLLLTIILFWKVHILFCPFTLKQQKWLSTFEEESNTTTKKSIAA